MDTLEKIYDQITKLYKVSDNLINILDEAGLNSVFAIEGTEAYSDLLFRVKDLRTDIKALIEKYEDNYLFTDIECEVNPTPRKTPNQPLDAIAKNFPPEKIKVGKINLVEFAGKVVMGAKPAKKNIWGTNEISLSENKR